MKNFANLFNVFKGGSAAMKKSVSLVVIKHDRQFELKAQEGENLMDVTNRLVNEGVEIFGLCDKQLACTTCSVHILNKYDQLKPPSEIELDILFSLSDFRYDTTRMSCQILLTKEMDGMIVKIPDNLNLQKDARIAD